MKDPAFLFYSSDFLSGTMLMSDEDVGKYIKLLCLQHQQGHLTEEDMLSMKASKKVLSKFKKDENGNYYNERLEYEANKRKAYSESRRNNRKKKITYEEDIKNICNSYEEHMENENININKNINENKDNRVIGEEEKKTKKPTAKASKHKYGEYQNVLLKDEELQKLKLEYPNWQDLIKYLDEYIEMKGYKANSHYLCIKKWVVDAVEKNKSKNKTNAMEEFMNEYQ